MISELLVGPQYATDGQTVTQRAGKLGENIISELNGRYFENAYRGNVFFAATQAAVTLSASLSTTTVVGLVLSNPVGSGKILVPLQAGVALTGAIVGIVGLTVMPYSATAVTHTTVLAVKKAIGFSTVTDNAGLVDSGATVPLAPVVATALMAAISTNTAVSPAPGLFDLGGSLIVAQGCAVAIMGSAAVTALLSMLWAELPA